MLALLGLMALELSGCGRGSSGSSAPRYTLDSDLFGNWFVANSTFTEGIALQFTSPTDYKMYQWSVSSQCELYATGTMRSAGGKIYPKRKTGFVSDLWCQKTYFEIPDPDPYLNKEAGGIPYLVNPGVSLTLTQPGLTIVMVPASIDWSGWPQAPTTPYATPFVDTDTEMESTGAMGSIEGSLQEFRIGW